MNGKFCGKAEVQLKTGNVVFWPDFPVYNYSNA